jgi:hypothetical protein
MLTGISMRNEEHNIGKKPILSPTEMPSILFRMRIRKTARSKDMEKRSVANVNASSLFLYLSAFLPRKNDPKASRMSQLARTMPIVNSLPEKTIRNSLNRSISATNPLNPIANIAMRTRFIIRLNLFQCPEPGGVADKSAAHRYGTTSKAAGCAGVGFGAPTLG